MSNGHMSDLRTLAPGLADPAHDAQQLFRAILDATSHPGRIVSLPAAPAGPGALSAAATAYLLTLADRDTPVWLAERVRPARGPRLPALPCRRADRGAARRRGLRRPGVGHAAALGRLQPRHRRLSRPFGHPDRRSGRPQGRADAAVAWPGHRRPRGCRRCRPRPTISGKTGPPTTACFPAASTSSSPPAPSSAPCRAASPWRLTCTSQSKVARRPSPIPSTFWPTSAAAIATSPSSRWSRSTSSSGSPSIA